jgi:hypothetical protein
MTPNPSLFARFRADERGALVSDLAKSAVAIGFLSIVAAHLVSNRIDANEKARMAEIAQQVSKGRSVDTTGSLARDANAMKLDPCALPPKR